MFEFIEAHRPHFGLLKRFGPELKRGPDSTNSNAHLNSVQRDAVIVPHSASLRNLVLPPDTEETRALSISIKDRSFPPKKYLTSFSFLYDRCEIGTPAAEMPRRAPTNEGIDLTQMHPAFANGNRDGFHGSQMSEWPGETYEAWKRFTTYNDSSAEDLPQTQSPPHSLHRSDSNRSSIKSNGSRLSSFEMPIVAQRLSYPVPKEMTGPEVIVDFDGKDDPYRPINWPLRKKVITTTLYGFTTCWVTFASAIYSTGVEEIAHDFHTTIPVSTAGISMVVFGFGLGPLLWAPLSEVCSA